MMAFWENEDNIYEIWGILGKASRLPLDFSRNFETIVEFQWLSWGNWVIMVVYVGT